MELNTNTSSAGGHFCGLCGVYTPNGQNHICPNVYPFGSNVKEPLVISTSTGWQCPKCHRIYSPSTAECSQCNFDVRTAEIEAEAAEESQAYLLREKIAQLAHEQWSGWMDYLFSKGVFNPDGTWTMPVEFVERWQRQARTPYAELSSPEQDSNRKEADKFLAVL